MCSVFFNSDLLQVSQLWQISACRYNLHSPQWCHAAGLQAEQQQTPHWWDSAQGERKMEVIQQQKHHKLENNLEKFCLNWETAPKFRKELVHFREQFSGLCTALPSILPHRAPAWAPAQAARARQAQNSSSVQTSFQLLTIYISEI